MSDPMNVIEPVDEPPFLDPEDDSYIDEEDIMFIHLTKTCESCGGEGEVLTRFAGRDPIGYDYDMARCPNCMGTGLMGVA